VTLPRDGGELQSRDNDGDNAGDWPEATEENKMPTDRYTKIILTIIAISLSVVALRPFFSPGNAAAEMQGCGFEASHPCYIAGWGPEGTVPVFNSAHLPLKVLVGNRLPTPMPVIVVNSPQPFGRP
jgi:hypothetical protein